ncbi:hypothetical protein, partial [Shewanella algae]
TVAETCGNFLARYGILWKPFRLFPATDTASRKCSSIRISYLGEDIYELKKYMPNSIPVCMDGNGNICVAKIVQERISGYYIANCGDLGWDEAKFVAKSLVELINDQVSPESRLNT